MFLNITGDLETDTCLPKFEIDLFVFYWQILKNIFMFVDVQTSFLCVLCVLCAGGSTLRELPAPGKWDLNKVPVIIITIIIIQLEKYFILGRNAMLSCDVINLSYPWHHMMSSTMLLYKVDGRGPRWLMTSRDVTTTLSLNSICQQDACISCRLCTLPSCLWGRFMSKNRKVLMLVSQWCPDNQLSAVSTVWWMAHCVANLFP